MTKQQGYLFLGTLACLSFISLIMLHGLYYVFSSSKIANQHQAQQQKFYQLDYWGHYLARKKPSCVIEKLNANELINHLRKGGGCVLTDGVRYAFTDLGEYPCISLDVANKLWSTHHFLITLVDEPDVLQLRLLRPAKGLNCFGQTRQAHATISSWRYLRGPGADG